MALRTLKGHADRVSCLAITRDGRYLVSGSWDRKLKVWDMQTWQETATLSGHRSYVYCVDISQNGRTVASGGQDDSVMLWDTTTGNDLATLTGHNDTVTAVALSPDHLNVASGAKDGEVKLWSIRRRAVIFSFSGPREKVESLTFDRFGTRLWARYTSGKVLGWSTESGDEINDEAPTTPPLRLADGRLVQFLGAEVVLIDQVREAEWARRSLSRLAEACAFDADWHRQSMRPPLEPIGTTEDLFALLFHLDHLIGGGVVVPAQREPLLKLRARLLCGLMDAGDAQLPPWVLTALARQMGTAPLPGVDRRRLLLAMTNRMKYGLANGHRILGALQLRAGAPEAAISSLETALSLRSKEGGPNTPIEELLLALAHARLGHGKESALYLDRAERWDRARRTAACAVAGVAAMGGGGVGPLAAVLQPVLPTSFRLTDEDALTTWEVDALLDEARSSLPESGSGLKEKKDR
jgi:hypothetical protein